MEYASKHNKLHIFILTLLILDLDPCKIYHFRKKNKERRRVVFKVQRENGRKPRHTTTDGNHTSSKIVSKHCWSNFPACFVIFLKHAGELVRHSQTLHSVIPC